MQPSELKAIRQALDMTQEEFAAALDLGRKTIMRMEAGGEVDKRTALAARFLTIKAYWMQASLGSAQCAICGGWLSIIDVDVDPTCPGSIVAVAECPNGHSDKATIAPG